MEAFLAHSAAQKSPERVMAAAPHMDGRGDADRVLQGAGRMQGAPYLSNLQPLRVMTQQPHYMGAQHPAYAPVLHEGVHTVPELYQVGTVPAHSCIKTSFACM